MKITRALLLSSRKQAEAWEYASGFILFKSSSPKMYRFLVTQGDERSLRFQIYCVSYLRGDEPVKRGSLALSADQEVVAEQAHFDEFFNDMGRLRTFLHRYQIDADAIWEPVESESLGKEEGNR